MAKAKTLHPDTKKAMEDLGNEIVAALKDEFFEVEGTPMAIVKYEDGTFKQKPLMAGWLFSLSYAYVGAAGQLIFGMEPEDSQEYKFIERNPKELDAVFPLAGGKIAEAFKVEGENAKAVIDSILKGRLDTVKQAQEVERKQAEAALESNDLYGAF